MKARGLAALTPKAALTPYEFERRELGAHDVALKIAYAGFCHSDIHQVREEWGPTIFLMVSGHLILDDHACNCRKVITIQATASS